VQIRCSKQQEGTCKTIASYSRIAIVVSFFFPKSHTFISAGYTSLFCSVLFTVQLLSYNRLWIYLVIFDHWNDKLI
jgi:hypothetical protein